MRQLANVVMSFSLAALSVLASTGCAGMGNVSEGDSNAASDDDAITNFIGSASVIRGNGVAQTEARELGAFTAINSDFVVDVKVVSGDAPKIQVTCDKNLLQFIETVVRNGTLTIRASRSNIVIRPKTQCEVAVTAVGLTRVALNGSADINLTGTYDALANIILAGDGSISAEGLDVPDLAITLDGLGDVNVQGKAQRERISLSGDGTIDALQLVANDVRVDLDGIGDIQLNATSSVRGTLDGEGSIVVAGRPQVRQVRVDGLGEVTFQ